MTSAETTYERLRRANPAVADPAEHRALFAAIVAAPGDPRLASGPRPRRGLPLRRYLVALVAVLALSAGTAWATSGGSPLAIFTANPQESGRADSPWHQTVIPGTVHPVASVTIPNIGQATFWYARTRQGGWCSAIRLPGGGWAGTGEESESIDAGGTVPGCQPTRSQINAGSGGAPVFEIDGFDYDEDLVGDRSEAHGFWRILFGEVSGKTAPTTVVDEVSGREAPVEEGHLFVLAVPNHETVQIAPVHLVATAPSSPTPPRGNDGFGGAGSLWRALGRSKNFSKDRA
jgi:hypothetical protein